MPTINVEMMKQLLQEFSEKETLAGEEVKVIEEQIKELEGRIVHLHTRSKYITEDREKLATIMGRYVGNDGSSKSVLKIDSHKVTVDPEKTLESVPLTRATEHTAAKMEKGKSSASESDIAHGKKESISTQSAHKDTKSKKIQPEKTEEEIENKSAGSADKQKETGEAAGGDDTIKSINDALKGLFRK